ncbi:DNA polymerase III subunit gamma/tau [Pasteurella atlantica]|uniref:DNA polymerase III subunit gamma/tau n=1 Tax=Pasteurellaceae TaxID=712 RepID=UPI00275A34D2|nr:DNA polymerase III subunit gamma/tau [Pasteurella atlantica]MDP8033554.1 DNA polymerase III subunit gamma/tau [Pasteurella atlantica]MDP8035489.1 DNA polymerase III subunit gamma/tau [Pasteurella atlantica]MDP8037440.1 DNA polymerase III subunit gamma/tau [Pasteurella atlantica]MDP8047789.1 DNA polymerase III subunit gamma/tau [Pasteurella atlantica]MDP8049650.1 DNA polymerase III subunit gamma/tau [Pasteurella atlantica]
MSYQVLARKWRPQRFQDVVGQKHVLMALENGLREERLHHAYLFSGTRGVGKTSIARLLAKGLNCEKGISATPCSECENCKAIEEGRFIDLIEIDAASRTKVEDTREVLDNVQYKPTVGRFKVYLIDEVHMLSRHSFNALLKTLEEPPEYVKFLLATTDPQKLPITILSRCMQFHLRALDQHQISDHLAFILNQENIPFEELALEKLAKSAQGSIRDALSLTDQAIAVSNANITLPIVQQMLGLLDDNQPLELVQALALADGEKLMAVIDDVAHRGVDWQSLLSAVAETLHQIAILQLLPNTAMEETPLHFLAKRLSPEDIQFFYQLMLMGKKDLPFASEPREGVEMTMLRALAFHPKRIENEVISVATIQQNNQSQIAVVENVSKQAVTSSQQFANSDQQVTAMVELVDEKKIEKNSLSPALAALQAREQLKNRKAKLNETEKKKVEVKPAITEKKKTQSASDLQQRLASLTQANSTAEIVEKQGERQEDDEHYRWQWLDPELGNEIETAKPSDIKQAILQQRTPELTEKITQLSCERDRWCQIIYNSRVSGLSRLMALNCYIADQKEDKLQLVLTPAMAHLDKPEIHQALIEALKEQDLSYSLTIAETIPESQKHQTALEIKREIFEQLTNEAKSTLINDPKLNLLSRTFNAEIDESTIRPVA